MSNQSQVSPARRLRIFLCHSSSDKHTVRIIYQQLKVCNVDPWLDEENLLPGQDWQQEIRKAVRTTDVVVVCLSQGSINKTGFVQKEIKIALDMADEQPESTIFLIPLKLEMCELPERLKHLHAVNYFEENGFNKLLSALKIRSETLSKNVIPIASPSNFEIVKPPISALRPEDFAHIRTFTGHSRGVRIAIHPNGKILASGSDDSFIKLWNIHTGELLDTLPAHKGILSGVWSVTFSSDGQFLASGGADKKVKLWNPRTSELLYTFTGHASTIHSVAISPDGQLLVSGSADRTIKLWNTHTGSHATACSCASRLVRLVPCTLNSRRRPSGRYGCVWATLVHTACKSRFKARSLNGFSSTVTQSVPQ